MDRAHYQYEKGGDLDASLQHFYDAMKSFYQVEVELPLELPTERKWELQIVDETGKKRKDVEVAYARKLVSCHKVPAL